MAFPIFVFNSGTGSDGLTSGAGPAVAITGTAAAHTSGSASTTITLTNSPDLSGVAVDGSHAARLVTPSGRQWSKITGKDNSAKTITVEDSFNIASGSPVDYAIGGKRATFDHANSRLLIQDDVKGFWILETETDQTITSALNLTASGSNTTGLITLRGSSSFKKLLQSSDAEIITGSPSYWKVCNLHFQNSSVSKTNAWGISVGSGIWLVHDCIFGDQTNPIRSAFRRASVSPRFYIINCEIKYCVVAGITGAFANFYINNCWSHHNGGIGFDMSPLSAICMVLNCVASNNGTSGFNTATGGGTLTGSVNFENCLAYGNTGNGFSLGTTRWFPTTIRNCQSVNNGGYGIQAGNAAWVDYQDLIDFNNYYGNTSGPYSNVNPGSHDLAVDPQFRNPSAGDFAPTSAAFRSQGFPRTVVGQSTSTRAHLDIGLQQASGDGMGARTYLMGLGRVHG